MTLGNRAIGAVSSNPEGQRGERGGNGTEPPLRGKPTGNFCWQDNELSAIFQPIIGVAAYALYCHLTGKAFQSTFTFTLRGLAAETKRSRTTVWRALAVLKQIGMVRIREGGGNQESECSLVNLKELAVSLGASYNRKAASHVLPPNRIEELRSQSRILRGVMEAKKQACRESDPASRKDLAHLSGANLFLLDTKRDPGVSPEKQQRSTGETQAESYLIPENGKLKNVPSPTPSRKRAVQNPRDFPNEEEPGALLKYARNQFIGVMNDMGDHLFNSSQPPLPHLANGFADWQEFGFDSLAVEAAATRGNELMLVLSAFDLAAARRGLDKYRRTWEASLLKWFGGKVQIELQLAASIR